MTIFIVALGQRTHAGDTGLLDALSAAKTAGYMKWTVISGKKDFIDLRCLVTKDPELGHQLQIFRSKGPKPLFEFRPGDSFVGMFPTSDAGDLVTIWLGGSAFHFYIFSFQDDTIRLTLETGSYMMLEFVQLEGDDKPAIIIVSDTRWDKNSVRRPAKATIYKWKRDRYLKFKVVDWRNRFRALGQ